MISLYKIGLLYVYLIRILCLLPLALIGAGIHVSKVHSIAFFIVYPILILIAIAYLVYMLPKPCAEEPLNTTHKNHPCLIEIDKLRSLEWCLAFNPKQPMEIES